MEEQIVVTIARPDVGVHYVAASREAEMPDRLAAAELAFHALARHIRELRSELGMSCPPLISQVADSDLWQRGM